MELGTYVAEIVQCGRAPRVTKALLQSKLRQVKEEERRKKQKRPRRRPNDEPNGTESDT